jgi:hypothetical protein
MGLRRRWRLLASCAVGGILGSAGQSIRCGMCFGFLAVATSELAMPTATGLLADEVVRPQHFRLR